MILENLTLTAQNEYRQRKTTSNLPREHVYDRIGFRKDNTKTKFVKDHDLQRLEETWSIEEK